MHTVISLSSGVRPSQASRRPGAAGASMECLGFVEKLWEASLNDPTTKEKVVAPDSNMASSSLWKELVAQAGKVGAVAEHKQEVITSENKKEDMKEEGGKEGEKRRPSMRYRGDRGRFTINQKGGKDIVAQ